MYFSRPVRLLFEESQSRSLSLGHNQASDLLASCIEAGNRFLLTKLLRIISWRWRCRRFVYKNLIRITNDLDDNFFKKWDSVGGSSGRPENQRSKVSEFESHLAYLE